MDADCFLDADGNFDMGGSGENLPSKQILDWYCDLEKINEQETTVSTTAGIETMDPRVVNVIATAVFNTQFKLFEIATNIRNAEYNPKRMKAVTIRIRDPGAVGRIFGNGKIHPIL